MDLRSSAVSDFLFQFLVSNCAIKISMAWVESVAFEMSFRKSENSAALPPKRLFMYSNLRVMLILP